MISEKLKLVLWFVVLTIVGAAVFFPGVNIPYYGDDFQFVFDEASPKAFYHYFYNNIQENNFYRPLQAAYLTIVQHNFGLNTLPVHVLQIFVHVLLSWLVFVSILHLGFAKLQAVTGSLFMLLSQANVHSVLSNDTLSQAGGTYFGCLAVWLVYLYCAGSQHLDRGAGGTQRHRYYYLGLFALALSYLSKESSSFFIVMVMVIFALSHWQRQKAMALASLVRRIAPFLLLTLAYLFVRSLVAEAQPTLGAEKYDFHIGANVVKNMAMFLFAGTIPASSVDAFVALKSGAVSRILVMVGLTVLFLLVVGFGLFISRRSYRKLLVISGFAVVGMFPMVLMNHVSELYVYNIMPFVSILVGVGLGKYFDVSGNRRGASVALTAIVCILFASHIVSIRSKSAMMQACGERASVLLEQIEPYVGKVPTGGKLLLVNPPDDKTEYSVFLASGFNVLENGLHRIHHISGKRDFEIKIIEIRDVEVERTGTEANCLALSLSDEGAVREYN